MMVEMAIPNEKLETARMRKRWSVAVASEKAGVSVNTFNRWERGLQVPQLGTLDLVCKAFDLPPEELGFERAITAKRKPQEKKASHITTKNAITSDQIPIHVSSETGRLADIMPSQPVIDEVQGCVEQARRSLDSMSQRQSEKGGGGEVSRRQAITALIGTTAAVFGLTQSAHAQLLSPGEVLSLCTMNIPLIWQLYFEGGLAEVGQILPGYLSQLTALAKNSSHYQRRAASMASQGYQLASLLALQSQNFGTAQTYAQWAFEYGKQTEDFNLQTASLIRLALVYFYLKRAEPRLHAYQKALTCSHNSSPLLQGRVYIGLTEAYSKLGNRQDAQHCLELAHSTFPERPEEDPNFSYTHFNASSLSSFEGKMYLNLDQPRQAWNSFARLDKIVPNTLIPNRVELTVHQAATACAMGELEQTYAYVECAVTSALAMGSQLRCNEAYHVYEHMLQKWKNEPKVKTLGEMFLTKNF